MKLSVIILNYQVADLTVNCLRSLEPEVRALGATNVVVLENGSGDDSPSRIQQALEENGWSGWVQLIVSTANLGFSGGNNLVLRQILDASQQPDYVLLLNPDTIVTPGSLSALVRFMDSNPDAGIAGSRLEFPDGGEQGSPFRFQSIGSELDRGFRLGIASRLLRPWAVCLPKPTAAAPVDWVAGAAMIVRRTVLQQAGLLDEAYFTYFEDMDYCLRAKQAGWSTWYVPESRIIHLEGRSSGVGSAIARRRPEYWFAARRHYFVKNHGLLYAAAVDAAFLIACAIGYLRLALPGKRTTEAPHMLADSWRNSVFVKGLTAGGELRTLAIQGTFWTFIGFAFSQLLRLAANLITTRLLAPEWFGLMALGNVITFGLNLFTDVGTGSSVIREHREDRPFLDTVWSVQVLRGAVLWFLSLLLALPLAALYHDPRLTWLIPLLGFGALLSGFSSTSLLTLARHLEVRRLVLLDLATQFIGLTVMVLWAWRWPSLWPLIAGALIPGLLKMVWSHSLGVRNHFAWEHAALRQLITFGRWILVSSALAFLASQVDRLLLAKLLPMSKFGVYGIALMLSEMPRALLLAAGGAVLYPVCAKLAQSQLPRPELRARILRYRRPVLAATAFALALLAGVGDLLVAILYDQRYADARWMLPVLAAGLWPAALAHTIDPALTAIGKPVYQASANAAKLLFTAFAVPAGFAHWGISGAVTAVALNDLPVYLAIGYGLRKEGLHSLRDDLVATLLFAFFLAVTLLLRRAAGLGTP